MKAATVMRHMLGYAIGISLFFALIPWGFYRLSISVDPAIGAVVVGNDAARTVVSIVVLVPGVVFALWSNTALLFMGKGGPTDGFGVAISPRTQHLVIRGPYRFTRNPMVFGALSCYFAFAVFLNSAAVLITLVVLIPLIIVYLKNTEEKRLERDFGDEYREYRKRVSMILPLPPEKG
jgi:protein-S-isoprenylcysteine O-methyltransferase Ste14